jgi:putative transposase
MKISRGYKFKLDPTAEQAVAFARNAGVCRLVYNIALEQRSNWYRQFRRVTGFGISVASQCRELTMLRAEVEWIAEGSVTAQQQALRDLETAFKNFFRKTADYPTPRKKGVNDSFRFQGNQVEFRRLNRSWGLVKLPKIGEVRFRWTRNIPGKLKNVTISLDPLGWHVSFATEQEVEVGKNFRPAVGIDRGVIHALAFSNGSFADLPKERMNVLERKARRHQRALSRCVKGSNRQKKTKRLVAGKKSKTARMRKHFNHVQSYRIARDYGIAVIEALKTKNMTASARGTVEEPGTNVAQKSGLSRAILEVGWFQFETFLTYKVTSNGGEVRKISPMHTSTTCSCCGVNDKTNRKSQAVYECCACGLAINADHNAAINILQAGTRPAPKQTIAWEERKSHLEGAGPIGLAA